MEKLCLDFGEKSYDILFESDFSGLVDAMHNINAPSKLLIVTDTNVEKLYAQEVLSLLQNAGFNVSLYAFCAGEENKNMDTILDICNACIENQLDRKSMIIALGGGVVGDMAGFAASIYMRGINFVQVPTTLLSQSDSSVGGKTGIDFCSNKNILGAFHQPKLVYINVSTLKTLPQVEFISGMGEVIKHSIIRDFDFFNYLQDNIEKVRALDTQTLIKMANRNCQIKAEVVVQDERESGLRAILNFGHTIGHAIESSFDFKMTHGECVGLGICGASYISYKRDMIDFETLSSIESILRQYGFHTRVKIPEFDVIFSFMQNDKKKLDGKLKFVLPTKIGDTIQVTDVTKQEIYLALEHILLED